MPDQSLTRPAFTQSIESFVRASGLTVTLYDGRGDRAREPLIAGRIAAIMQRYGAWSPMGGADLVETRLAAQCIELLAATSELVAGTLRVTAIPVVFEGRAIGVLVVGWVAERFASSLECVRVGRELKVPNTELWRAMRSQSPVTAQRMSVLLEVLTVVASAEVSHWVAEAKTREVERLRETFLARIAHDMRTPVAVVAMQVQDLIEHEENDKNARLVAYRRIQRSVAAQQRLVDDLMEVARTLTGTLAIRPVTIDLSGVLRELADSMQLTIAAKSLTFHVELGSDPLWIEGDEVRLMQVFINMLSNAIKFTGAGGSVTLAARRAGDTAVVEVRDTGVGMDEHTLRSLFEPFARTTDGNEQGWGLGMSIAAQLVELHGGTVAAESEGRDRGTTIRTLLPLSTGPARSKELAAAHDAVAGDSEGQAVK